MGLPIGDTPGKGFLSDGGSSSGQKDGSSVSPRFDFDEVVQGFPSPRGSAGIALGSSPSRWSMGSSSSGSVFMFPDSKVKDQGRRSSGENIHCPLWQARTRVSRMMAGQRMT